MPRALALIIIHAALLSLGTSPALAGPELLYGTGPLEPQALLKTSDEELVTKLLQYLRHFKIEVVEKLNAKGEAGPVWTLADEATHDMRGLNRAEQVALLAMIRRAETLGREADIYVPVTSGYVPVSITWDEAARVRLVSGEAFASLYGEAPTAEAIQEKYGVGAFVDGNRAWSDKGRWVVAKALSLLTEAELETLKGIPFHRQRVGLNHRAMYRREGSEPRVEVYDATFLLDPEQFEGTVTRHFPGSVGVLAHELGHAIADYAQRQRVLETKPAEQAFKDSVEEEKSILKEHKAAVKDVNSATTREQQKELMKTLNAITARLKAKQVETRGLQKKANDSVRQITQADAMARRQGGRAAERALAAVLPFKRAPTHYGRKSPTESFAESFRLYKTDPDALQRLAPEALQWFQAGKHLE